MRFPADGAHEIELVDTLIEQQRRFIKPLRYDARSTAGFPNVLLVDVGDESLPLHVVSAFAPEKEREAKVQVVNRQERPVWTWWTDQPMPPFPAVAGAQR
ncbi:MAG: DUF1173 domain-containing protein [Desulfovibrionaceae bacterium]|nr:DUF1173 domain-containing protein [Desulfovibrionaceae bacterium]